MFKVSTAINGFKVNFLLLNLRLLHVSRECEEVVSDIDMCSRWVTSGDHELLRAELGILLYLLPSSSRIVSHCCQPALHRRSQHMEHASKRKRSSISSFYNHGSIFRLKSSPNSFAALFKLFLKLLVITPFLIIHFIFTE